MRWVQMRNQVLRGEKPNGRHVEALRRIDQHLREVSNPIIVDPRLQTWDDTHGASIPADAVISHGGQNKAFANVMSTQELNRITDQHVVNDLRQADRRKRYWIDEDPTLERMLAWIRMQR